MSTSVLYEIGGRYFPFPSIVVPVLGVVCALLAYKLTSTLLRALGGG